MLVLRMLSGLLAVACRLVTRKRRTAASVRLDATVHDARKRVEAAPAGGEFRNNVRRVMVSREAADAAAAKASLHCSLENRKAISNTKDMHAFVAEYKRLTTFKWQCIQFAGRKIPMKLFKSVPELNPVKGESI